MAQLLLIVDADQGFTDPIRTAFEVQGVSVEVCDDAPLELIRRLRPSALLLSVELPKGATTGLSICSRLRRDRELKATPILLTSSASSGDTLKKHAQSNDRADDYASKPLDIDDVVERLGHLLARAPRRDTQDLGRAQSATTGDLGRPPSLPTGDLGRAPSITGDVSAGPPEGAVTGDLERSPGGSTRDIRPPSLPPEMPRRPGAQAPPPLKKEHIGAGTTIEELWRGTRLDEALRSLADLGAEPQAPPKASPEERLAFLRQLVKYHETRDKVFREAWEKVQAQGQDLARRTLMLGLDVGTRDRKIDEIQAERASQERRLRSVEEEFRAFQSEITRIFHEKDAEEQQTFAKISKLEADNASLAADLQSAIDRNSDHERRFRILQEEIEGQAGEKEAIDLRMAELEPALAAREAELEELRARLSMTENVAAERADEVARLEERLDRSAIETTQEKRRLEEVAATREREFAEEVETLQMQHGDAISAIERRAKKALEAAKKEHEAVLASMQTERDIASSRNDTLEETIVELEQRLEDAISEHATGSSESSAMIERLEASIQALEEDLGATRSKLEGVTKERDRLRRDLESNAADVAASLARIEALEASIDDERAGRRDEVSAFEATLESERAAAQTSREELEAMLEAERASGESRVVELTAQLEAERTGAGRSKTELEATLFAERATFEDVKAELEANLQAERAEFERVKAELEEQVDAAERETFDRMLELGKKGLEAEKASARAADLERQLMELVEAQSEREEALEAERAERAALSGEVPRLEAELARAEASLRDLAQERDAREAITAQEIGRLEAQLALITSREREFQEITKKRGDVLARVASLVADGAEALDQALGVAPPKARPVPDEDDPFSRLLADLEVSNREAAQAFERSFDGDSTASDIAAREPTSASPDVDSIIASELQGRRRRDRKHTIDAIDDEDADNERSVTEIVRIDRLK